MSTAVPIRMRSAIDQRLDRRRFVGVVGFVAVSASSCFAANHSTGADLRLELDETEIWTLHTRWVKVDSGDYLQYRREVRFEGRWRFAGETLRIRKSDHKAIGPDDDLLDPRVVPKDVRGFEVTIAGDGSDETVTGFRPPPTLPDEELRARHGLPPSEWIRSRDAKQLSRWLRSIDVPFVGVAKITVWDHLVSHHQFKPKLIRGLSKNELAMLHSAAHFGY